MVFQNVIMCYTTHMTHSIPHKMVFGGDCITKIDGKTVFICGALPNETVEIDIHEHKKDYDKAIVTRIITPSAHRVKPFCALYGVCGGCNLQFADYNFQLELKRTILEDCFTRLPYPLPPIEIICANAQEYRNRFQFHSGGLRKRSSKDIVTLNDCPCAVPEIRRFLQSEKASILKKHTRLHLFADKHIVGQDPQSKIRMAIDGQSECTIELLGKKITFDVCGFFQSNIDMLKKTIPLVIDGLKGKHLLDMYCGVGTLSIFATDYFDDITLVEHNKHSMRFAISNFEKSISNKKKKSTKIHSFAMRAEEWVKKIPKENFDAVIIDPPRSGIEKSVLEWLCTTKPAIRYLSCNPATLARDAKYFIEAGYLLEKLYLLDFYPHTSHIESLACFIPCDTTKNIVY